MKYQTLKKAITNQIPRGYKNSSLRVVLISGYGLLEYYAPAPSSFPVIPGMKNSDVRKLCKAIACKNKKFSKALASEVKFQQLVKSREDVYSPTAFY